ncbi:sugar kinase [Cryobacterium melibiosiphilum]
MTGRAPVLCIGETMVLVAPTTADDLEHAELFTLSLGGAESTVALYLSELGHSAEWLSQVGDDPLGRRLLAELSKHNVITSRVRVLPDAPTGVYFKDPGRASTSVYYYRSGSAASTMTPHLLEGIDWAATPVVHVSGITAGLSPECHAMLDAVFTAAAGFATTVSFDVNYRPGLWSPEAAAPALLDLARRADIVFVGLDEAQALWGIDDPQHLFRHLHAPGALVIKNGSVGATQVTADTETFVPAHTVEVLEVVGAGDAFAAGYLAGYLAGASVEERLSQGHDLAARALRSLNDFAPV